METLLSFFSDVILFTAGVFVLLLWAVIIVVMSVEMYDLVFEKNKDQLEEDEF